MGEILEGFLQDQVAILKNKIATLEAERDTAIALRDLEERNKIDFIQQLEALEAENARLKLHKDIAARAKEQG